MDAAEEIVQEAFAQALDHWPANETPDRPGAWLLTTARRRALDRLRRARRAGARADALAYEAALGRMDESPDVTDPEAIPDDRLRLIFTCCHPGLPADSRVALTLRLVGGLSTAEIARAFLAPEPTIAQRLVRAKRTIRDRGFPYEVPEGVELPARLPAVLAVVYLIFNEGYAAHTGDALVRHELCQEAIRLGHMLAELMPVEPEVLGLFALMELQASRAATRTDADGNLVLLADQDRSRWDRARIARGLAALDRAGPLERAGPYQLQAAIAACHARAVSWRSEEHTSEIQSQSNLVCRLLLEKKKKTYTATTADDPTVRLPEISHLVNHTHGRMKQPIANMWVVFEFRQLLSELLARRMQGHRH